MPLSQAAVLFRRLPANTAPPIAEGPLPRAEAQSTPWCRVPHSQNHQTISPAEAFVNDELHTLDRGLPEFHVWRLDGGGKRPRPVLLSWIQRWLHPILRRFCPQGFHAGFCNWPQ